MSSIRFVNLLHQVVLLHLYQIDLTFLESQENPVDHMAKNFFNVRILEKRVLPKRNHTGFRNELINLEIYLN